MARSIAERRHHRQRIRSRRRRYWGRDLSKEPKYLGMVERTPKPCSCWMCRNPRKAEGPTIQERRADEP